MAKSVDGDDGDMLDDDLEMSEWMKLSDAEQEAMIDREMKKYTDWFDGLSVRDQIRVERRSALKRIMENRNRLRRPELCTIQYVVDMWKEGIRRNQRRLLKIRIWRATGVRPGEA